MESKSTEHSNGYEEEEAGGLLSSESVGFAETDALIPVRWVSLELFA